MMHVIKHFMWGYQPHFRVGQESTAARLFERLDARLKPEVFLVGILADDVPDKFHVCIEPEDEFWIQSEDLNGVPRIAEGLRKTYPEAAMFQSHPIAQQRQDENLFKRSIQDAVRQAIEAHDSKPSDMEFRVSYPEKVESYWVCVALGLQHAVMSAYPRLQRASVAMHEHRHVRVPTSLIEAAAEAFLEAAQRDLRGPDPGARLSHGDPDDFLRTAGDRLTTGMVWRVDQNSLEGMYGLFRTLTTISSLRYEKGAGAGRVLIARKCHPAVSEKVSLAAPVKLTSYRSARKLLELASDELPLYCDPDQIYGLAQERGYSADEEDLFEVRIVDHHRWELKHGGQTLMTVRYGLPSLPKLPFDEDKLRTDLPRIFCGITSVEVERLVALARVAEEESHGTMLVVTEAAADEASRLARQATSVRPFSLNETILRNLTPIDGAIILEPSGVCHAIGTILDGRATDHGDPSRGARYNSAIRYYESLDAPCIIVIVSSDGGVDFVPDPRPAIRRSLIDSAIGTIVGMASAERIERKLYRQNLEWLDAHRFYLTEADCKTLNELVDGLEERIRRQDQTTIWIDRSPFVPDPAMNPALYYVNE